MAAIPSVETAENDLFPSPDMRRFRLGQPSFFFICQRKKTSFSLISPFRGELSSEKIQESLLLHPPDESAAHLSHSSLRTEHTWSSNEGPGKSGLEAALREQQRECIDRNGKQSAHTSETRKTSGPVQPRWSTMTYMDPRESDLHAVDDDQNQRQPYCVQFAISGFRTLRLITPR